MLRLVWTIGISLPFIIYYFFRLIYVEDHPDKFSEEDRYRIGKHMIDQAMRNSFVHTKAYGLENLPEEGGYVMYPNHQGKFDVLGIIHVHEKPCTIVIDEKRSHLPFANEVTRLLRGVRLDRTDMRAQVNGIMRIADEVKNGRRYILFPEGGYAFNENHLQEFLAGAFKCAVKSHCPIVPVVLVDSYIPFGRNGLQPVFTQVHFLPPIFYDEYKDCSTHQIADMVKKAIQDKLSELKKV
ncbi:MAG: 1-acyl-sn-glycerol-3-phosphate acyltransferase [Lachnospiraceae bacterium]|nr:1-acyl-sn-glycerol-3-phosphate acyltransferase [Lachnospiraceae bacterium]